MIYSKKIIHTSFVGCRTCRSIRPRIRLFNGAIHSLTFSRDLSTSMSVIVAFDLMEKKLLEMSFRDDFDHDHTYCDF